MELKTNEKAPTESQHYFVHEGVTVLTFGWHRDKAEYLTEAGERLGCAWGDVVAAARGLAVKKLGRG